MPTHFRKALKTLCSSCYISPYDCPMPFLSTETLTTAISPSLPFSVHALCFLLKVKTLNRNSPNFQPSNCVSLQLHPSSSLFLLKQSKYPFLSDSFSLRPVFSGILFHFFDLGLLHHQPFLLFEILFTSIEDKHALLVPLFKSPVSVPSRYPPLGIAMFICLPLCKCMSTWAKLL